MPILQTDVSQPRVRVYRLILAASVSKIFDMTVNSLGFKMRKENGHDNHSILLCVKIQHTEKFLSVHLNVLIFQTTKQILTKFGIHDPH